MYNFENELELFKKSIKVKKLTEKVSGKLEECKRNSVIKDRFVDVEALYSNVQSDSLLSCYSAIDLIETQDMFICLPTYSMIEEHLLQQV